MCGIVAYLGNRQSLPLLMEGLKRLEYRGYDSAGVAIPQNGAMSIYKAAGKIAAFEKSRLEGVTLAATEGIAHTRWATHGEPTDGNAHPHTDCTGRLALVHNGIIENHTALKRMLVAEGHAFQSDTDTEVLAHLIEKYQPEHSLDDAVSKALQLVDGTYGIAVAHADQPGTLVGARNGSPLVIGVGGGEYFLASDVAAILGHTRQVIYLNDGEMAVLTRDGYRTTTIHREHVEKEIQQIEWDLDMIEKGGYPHYMLKEIFEQPEAVRNAMRGRLQAAEGTAKLGGLNLSLEQLRDVKRIILIACGTSWHAGLIGEYLLEEHARIPVEVEYASEFRYRDPILDEGTLVLVISQSGETADTLAAMREARRKGARVLGIVNVVGSTIARESDGGVYIHAGPEIGVASTKAFTSQVTVLSLLTLHLGRSRGMTREAGKAMAGELAAIPGKIQSILEGDDRVKQIAEAYHQHNNFLYLGRGVNFPVALEGALKLKEISYIHAEGYPAAEMKHGPIALIDENMPVVVLATRDGAREKVLNNMQEVRARRGRIIAVATEGDEDVPKLADHTLFIPPTHDSLVPLLSVIPLQLLAYHMAVLRGCDVDQPRNLAKSVTVE
ncbi:MAG TPA: glutamine--fructose-6-phosphate transaminase (isomerizing) [Candidatus Eisenbacteria bacterium]|nr:glutamine--fructose-6-phosphate transaminase (isomerizing) [Candidatus Eisenbacteria bacterium]